MLFPIYFDKYIHVPLFLFFFVLLMLCLCPSVCIHIYMYIHMNICIYVYVCMYIYIYICMYNNTRFFLYIFIHVYMCLSLSFFGSRLDTHAHTVFVCERERVCARLSVCNDLCYVIYTTHVCHTYEKPYRKYLS